MNPPSTRPARGQYETDRQDVALAREGDTAAYGRLVERYRDFAEFGCAEGDDDLVQEGLLGLYKAIRDYRTDRELQRLRQGPALNGQIFTARAARARRNRPPEVRASTAMASLRAASGFADHAGHLLDTAAAAAHATPEAGVPRRIASRSAGGGSSGNPDEPEPPGRLEAAFTPGRGAIAHV